MNKSGAPAPAHGKIETGRDERHAGEAPMYAPGGERHGQSCRSRVQYSEPTSAPIAASPGRAYGCESFGRLRRVMVHTPGDELQRVREYNFTDWLFDRPPEPERLREEHLSWCRLLERHGVEVVQLSDHVSENEAAVSELPNLTYLHDAAVITSRGAILSRMSGRARRGEEQVVGKALADLGIPVWIGFNGPDDRFEGCLLLSRETVLVAETERHSRAAVGAFVRWASEWFREVVYVDVPKARRYMHPDTVFNRVDHDLALAFTPAFLQTFLFSRGRAREIDFKRFMAERGVEVIDVSAAEQERLACTFVPLEPGTIFHYDTALDRKTVRMLERRGVKVLMFHPEALTAGGGSLRCITLRLLRD